MEKITRNPWTGKVASVSTDGKTVKVEVERVVLNSLYGKRQRRKTVLLADCVGKTVQIGDKVEISPCRRVSRTKTWKIL